MAVPLFFVPGWGPAAALLWNAMLAVAAWYETRVLRASLPVVTRHTATRLLLGADNDVTIRLDNPSGYRLRATVRDDCPAALGLRDDGRGHEQACTLPAYGGQTLRYTVAPARRGQYRFGQIHLRVEGLLQLGAVLTTTEATEAVRVYPNLRGPKRYELAVRMGALHSVGIRHLRAAGGGGEFEQLRDYVAGDSYRDIDWKATAKRLHPITRVHGHERSQTVVIALDAGRMMATQLGDLTKLDHAIHAALLLAYVALRSGDKVGLIVFAEEVHAFVPPRRGQAHYRRILETLYAVEASLTYVDFRRLLEFVRVRLPRRALVVMFSDLLDESQAQPMVEQAGRLARKHLPLCVTMNDSSAEALAEAPVYTGEQAYRRAAAADILAEREAIKAQLHKTGVGLVEARAAELAMAAVNRYLAIKQRRAL